MAALFAPALLALVPFALRVVFALGVLVRPVELRLFLAVTALALPFWLRPLRALPLLVLPFELRPLLALDGLVLPFALRLALAPEALLLPFDFRLLFALEPRLLDSVAGDVLLAAVVRRARPLEALEARLVPLREAWPLRASVRFAAVRFGLDLLEPLEGRRSPLLLPSFEPKSSTASGGAFAVLPAPLVPFGADWPPVGERLRPVTSLPILLAATPATVAAPAPAAKPAAAGTRMSEMLLDA